MHDVDLDTIIYSIIGGLTSSGNTYLALKAVREWEYLTDISGLHWMELLFAFFMGALVTFKAKRSKSPTKDMHSNDAPAKNPTEKELAYQNTIRHLRDNLDEPTPKPREAMSTMNRLIILSIAVMGALALSGCFKTMGGGEPTNIDEARDALGRDHNIYLVKKYVHGEIVKCSPERTPTCQLSVSDKKMLLPALIAYRSAEDSCLGTGNCNPCSVMSLLSTLASITKMKELVGVERVCAGSYDQQEFLNELEESDIELPEITETEVT